MHLPINSYLGEEHSHEMDIAGEMSAIPLVPKLKTAEKSYLEKGNRKQRPPEDHWNVLFATLRKCGVLL